jgi:hypothetical protein
VAVVVGLVIGRLIRLRERDVREPPMDRPWPQIPMQNSGGQEPGEEPPSRRR